jgi:hypothetical protein
MYTLTAYIRYVPLSGSVSKVTLLQDARTVNPI